MKAYYRVIYLAVNAIMISVMSIFLVSVVVCILSYLLKTDWGFKIGMVPLGLLAILFCSVGLAINRATYVMLSDS